MEQDLFADRSHAFIHWLQGTPSTRVSSKIALEDFRSRKSGRGVGMYIPSSYLSAHLLIRISTVATADIADDEELFAIPRTLVLNIQNSDLQSRIPDSLKGLGPWIGLMLVMMYEYLKGKESLWCSYFQVLPRQFDTLMFWTESELAELQGSAVVNKIGKNQAEENIIKDIVPILEDNPSIFPPPAMSLDTWSDSKGRRTLLELAHIMGSLIMAYAFDIEEDAERDDGPDSKEGSFVTDEDDPPKGMVPLADMLNADADFNNVYSNLPSHGT
jgi:SET domain-containing protein 6